MVEFAGMDNERLHIGSDAYNKSKTAVSKRDGVIAHNMTSKL